MATVLGEYDPVVDSMEQRLKYPGSLMRRCLSPNPSTLWKKEPPAAEGLGELISEHDSKGSTRRCQLRREGNLVCTRQREEGAKAEKRALHLHGVDFGALLGNQALLFGMRGIWLEGLWEEDKNQSGEKGFCIVLTGICMHLMDR